MQKQLQQAMSRNRRKGGRQRERRRRKISLGSPKSLRAQKFCRASFKFAPQDRHSLGFNSDPDMVICGGSPPILSYQPLIQEGKGNRKLCMQPMRMNKYSPEGDRFITEDKEHIGLGSLGNKGQFHQVVHSYQKAVESCNRACCISLLSRNLCQRSR